MTQILRLAVPGTGYWKARDMVVKPSISRSLLYLRRCATNPRYTPIATTSLSSLPHSHTQPNLPPPRSGTTWPSRLQHGGPTTSPGSPFSTSKTNTSHIRERSPMASGTSSRKWGRVYVLTNDGQLFMFQEKLDILYRKSLCTVWDTVLAHMFSELHHTAVPRFAEDLTYLQELHTLGRANADHTTLLLITFTKLKDVAQLDGFIKLETKHGGGEADETVKESSLWTRR
ncbi:hypothetical protein APHAL10511_001461 [Amanita phalloides]|nr:hypothetical protein APHAL10511_001461 [Amanita phalloides]